MADEENLSEQEANIVTLLNYIKKLMEEPHLSAKNTRNVKEFMTQVLTYVELVITPENAETMLNVYDYLLNIDLKSDFCRVYGDNRMRIILNYNMAFCYQDPRHRNVDYILHHIEEALSEYLEFTKLKEGLKSSASTDHLKLDKFAVQICLQTAAMYGIIGMPERALAFGTEAFDYIGVFFNSFKTYFHDCNPNKGGRYYQLVTFLNDFRVYYEHLRSVRSNPSKSEMKAEKFLNWEYTPQNNEKYFTKSNCEYDQDLKFNSALLKDHNIGDIMFLTVISNNMFNESTYEDIFETDDFIIDFLLLFSCCLYTMSTEKRVISIFSEDELLKTNSDNRVYNLTHYSNDYSVRKDMHSALNAQKAISLSQNSLFIESQFFIKKCLECLNRYLKPSMLFNIVLTQYHKHYPKVVNYITEEEEPSQTFSALFTDRKEKKSVLGESEDISKSNIVINNINITHNTCNIDPAKSFKKKIQDGNPRSKSRNKMKIDLTPIKTSINDISNGDNNIAKDMDQILNELKTSPTLEPRTSQESNGCPFEHPLATKTREEKIKTKVLLPKKAYLTKNAKILKELIESQKDDIVIKRLKNMFTKNKQPTIDNIKNALLTKDMDKQLVSNAKLVKNKSQDLRSKVKDVIKTNIFNNPPKKGSVILGVKGSKADINNINLNKCKEAFAKHNKTLATKLASPRLKLDFSRRKNSPLQSDRQESCVSLLKKYRTVDLTYKKDALPESSRNLKSPRAQYPTLDIKTIKANLKNSTMKSSRSRERKKLEINGLKSLDDYRSLTLDGDCLSSKREPKPRANSPGARHPRVMSSTKLSSRLN